MRRQWTTADELEDGAGMAMTAEKLEAMAAEAATVVNGRINGGFGLDMAAAVAMNDLTVRELF